jgi:hypothetical protein
MALLEVGTGLVASAVKVMFNGTLSLQRISFRIHSFRAYTIGRGTPIVDPVMIHVWYFKMSATVSTESNVLVKLHRPVGAW